MFTAVGSTHRAPVRRASIQTACDKNLGRKRGPVKCGGRLFVVSARLFTAKQLTSRSDPLGTGWAARTQGLDPHPTFRLQASARFAMFGLG
jgi:hypothetical protein